MRVFADDKSFTPEFQQKLLDAYKSAPEPPDMEVILNGKEWQTTRNAFGISNRMPLWMPEEIIQEKLLECSKVAGTDVKKLLRQSINLKVGFTDRQADAQTIWLERVGDVLLRVYLESSTFFGPPNYICFQWFLHLTPTAGMYALTPVQPDDRIKTGNHATTSSCQNQPEAQGAGHLSNGFGENI
jgi:hypothetical protein